MTTQSEQAAKFTESLRWWLSPESGTGDGTETPIKPEVELVGQQLSEREWHRLDQESLGIGNHLKQSYGMLACPEHGQPESLTALVRIGTFPDIDVSFKDACCHVFDQLLRETGQGSDE